MPTDHATRGGPLAAPLLATLLLLAGCTGVPEGVTPVQDFDLSRYLGTWYEIARLDHSFERGLAGVHAHYEVREDGGVAVTNRGFATDDGEWREALGRAYFTGEPTVAHLKVAFFGPFYGSYVVFELDRDDYSYAFVSGFSRDYLWLLARERTVDDATRERFLARSRELGFDTESLIWVDQDEACCSPRPTR